jgi:pantoate--beta-alanine ligase
LFLPDAAEIYPSGFSTYVHVEGLSERLEGKSRPGHFRGVATVVLKLFEIVQPHYAYFGRKDAQQVRIIQKMVHDLNLDVELVICPTVREADGLAMSSRNAYLDGEERKAATVLFRALQAAERELCAGVTDTLELKSAMREVLEHEPRARVDYAEIVDAETYEPVVRVGRRCYALLAVRVGNTRLIDNMLIRPHRDGFEVELWYSARSSVESRGHGTLRSFGPQTARPQEDTRFFWIAFLKNRITVREKWQLGR